MKEGTGGEGRKDTCDDGSLSRISLKVKPPTSLSWKAKQKATLKKKSKTQNTIQTFATSSMRISRPEEVSRKCFDTTSEVGNASAATEALGKALDSRFPAAAVAVVVAAAAVPPTGPCVPAILSVLNLRRVVSLRGLDVVNLRFDAFNLDEAVTAAAVRV